ncbi:hypothetical protein CAL29_22710 [Bordetella genomosp. 10]|uniref:Uncharacterized protein n=1 Tax=Bordetella genomosp. 10 TaxID=1416804 RepID=A0A261S1C3_9BORD|nr:hypothetical protein [Bordetella genomosp. 10]OZI30797.1 hypothetical protein CAL29_22710 [Bordetella genomosp. 10]
MDEARNNALIHLYKNNVELFQKLTDLMDRSGRQWTEQQRKHLRAAIADTEMELMELLSVADTSTLVATQARIVQRHWEGRQRLLQDLLQDIASGSEMKGELMAALTEWYQGVLGMGAADMTPITAPWIAYLNQFSSLMPRAPEDAGGKRPSRGK